MKDTTCAAITAAFKERIDRAAAAASKASTEACVREAFRAKAVELFENTIRPALREIMESIPASIAKVTPFEQDLKKPDAIELAIGFELELTDEASGSVKPRLTFKARLRESQFAVVWHHAREGAWSNTERRSRSAEEITSSSVEDDAVEFLLSVASVGGGASP